MDLRSLTLEELKADLAEHGEKAFRAGQIYDWVHKKCVASVDEMSNLSKQLRENLKEWYEFEEFSIARCQISQIDGTRKYLFALSDGNMIESVLMRYQHGNSVCISSQVGCRMGCAFCASTLDGLVRNLTAGEMLGQIYRIEHDTGERVANVVVMGSGEPMDNFDNIVKFIGMLTDKNGLNISQRNVTVSTCGLVPKMKELADKQFQITLALSLHATTDERRRTLMLIANRYSIDELMEACKYYFDKTGRRITFEYSLVRGVNDSEEEAVRLAALAGPVHAHINLIPVNPIKERSFLPSDKKRIRAFQNKLEKNGINVTIRREMGRDIDGACGQLRRKVIEENQDGE
ncbi:MAG: 23S rRNA (adenine(2503)-C(2))-methyltransferase RlmN [Lachnospiraceae bacterium]|nr:23S rRNA (adenine(2503)-C(2))-methyltransferase RlmN [Lachnospiraceae bacterium]